MAWVLVLALVVTWSCVAIVLFDLLDYQTLVEYTSYCDDPCLPPVSGSTHPTLTGSADVTAEEGTDWLAMLWALLSSLVAPEEEEGEGIQQLTDSFTSFVSDEL
ncbi:triadin-like [Aplochiton taeniatus]